METMFKNYGRSIKLSESLIIGLMLEKGIKKLLGDFQDGVK